MRVTGVLKIEHLSKSALVIDLDASYFPVLRGQGLNYEEKVSMKYQIIKCLMEEDDRIFANHGLRLTNTR